MHGEELVGPSIQAFKGVELTYHPEEDRKNAIFHRVELKEWHPVNQLRPLNWEYESAK